MPLRSYTIGFIGGGNMARSLIGGLVAADVAPGNIWAADHDPRQLERLNQSFPIHTTGDNRQVVAESDVVVLAVKPQTLKEVMVELAEAIRAKGCLVVSVAAGIREADLQRWLGGGQAVVRAMPNTPALVQCGATALYAGKGVSAEKRDLAENILRAAGLTLWVEEEAQMDAVTALSGSGPAYFFLLMEALEEAGAKLGLSPKAARLLTVQTAFGAAKMALESHEEAAELRRRVTSPGGTTERAIHTFEEGGLRPLVERALGAARDRSAELAEQLGK